MDHKLSYQTKEMIWIINCHIKQKNDKKDITQTKETKKEITNTPLKGIYKNFLFKL